MVRDSGLLFWATLYRLNSRSFVVMTIKRSSCVPFTLLVV